MKEWVCVVPCPGRFKELSMRGLRIQPQLHTRFQHTQWHRAVVKNGIMGLAHIESCAKFLFCFRTQFANLAYIRDFLL